MKFTIMLQLSIQIFSAFPTFQIMYKFRGVKSNNLPNIQPIQHTSNTRIKSLVQNNTYSPTLPSREILLTDNTQKIILL